MGIHESLIPNSPKKPIRIWMEVGDRDLYNPNSMRDNMHDWVVANENMAKVLAAKGYTYQFLFVKNAGHCDRAMKEQTLPEALEYIWQDYPRTPDNPEQAESLLDRDGHALLTIGDFTDMSAILKPPSPKFPQKRAPEHV